MEEEDNDGRLKLKSSLLVWLSAKVMIENETFRTHCIQPSSLVCEKHVRKRKGAVKTRMTVLKMRITCKQKCDQNVCELWFAECTLFRLQS